MPAVVATMTAPTCIDLVERFGAQYRIAFEEQVSDWPVADRPWLARIACRYGHVGVQGDERLFAFTARPRIGAQLRAIPFIEHAQGGAEVRAVFHVDHLDAVLSILRPYRRRRVSGAERSRLATIGAAHRFGKGADNGVQSDFPAPESMERSGEVGRAGTTLHDEPRPFYTGEYGQVLPAAISARPNAPLTQGGGGESPMARMARIESRARVDCDMPGRDVLDVEVW